VNRYLSIAAAAALAVGGSAPAMAATSQPAATAGKLIAMSTSWVSAQSGIVLAYPSRSPGAKPTLYRTSNAGQSWTKLPAPPVTFPKDNDVPDATWSGSIIAISTGTSAVISHDNGNDWHPVTLAGKPTGGMTNVGHITIADGHLYTMVSNITGTASKATVFSGAASGKTMKAVPGLTISGSVASDQFPATGDISSAGPLEVSLNYNYAQSSYWVSTDGTKFTKDPAPCAAGDEPLLGGVRGGKPVALCSTEPSSVGAGSDAHTVRTAPKVGGMFSSAGPQTTGPNELGYDAATPQDGALASSPGLYETTNAGKTWTVKIKEPNGSSWADLAFLNSSTGTVDAMTVNNSLKLVGAVYRTTDGGQTWKPLSLPA